MKNDNYARRNREKSNISIAILDKNKSYSTIIISFFFGVPIIFSPTL